MSDPVEPLVLDLLEWLGRKPRRCSEVMEVWRTSCPRLPVWEEANQRGLVDHIHEQGQPALIAVSSLGRSWLASQRSSLGNLSSAQTAHSEAALSQNAGTEQPTP